MVEEVMISWLSGTHRGGGEEGNDGEEKGDHGIFNPDASLWHFSFLGGGHGAKLQAR